MNSEVFLLNFCSREEVSRLRVLHYGSSRFDPARFKKVVNWWQKPLGGLWTCPTGAHRSWKEVVESELESSSWRLDRSFILKFSDKARIVVINSIFDLLNLPRTSESVNEKDSYVDWEKLSELSDAVWLTEKGRRETILTVPLDLTMWDCETVLIMNKDACIEL